MESAKKTASHLRDRGIEKQIDEALEGIIPKSQELKERTTEYLHQAQAKLGEMGEKLEQMGRNIEAQIQKNPVRTAVIGVAALAGIAYLLSRRLR